MVRNTPPGRLAAMYAARERELAGQDVRLAEVLLMTGESDWGSESRWAGNGSQPRSDWKTSNQRLLAWLSARMRVSQGLPPEESLDEKRARIRSENKAARAALMN